MDTAVLSGTLFMNLVRGGAANLDAKRAQINDLNVFPIPDGDTGDNMYMTLRSGLTVNGEDRPLGEVASEMAHGMLLGARGNSGVILSRIFSGIAEGFNGRETADAAAVAKALQSGIRQAYDAVSSPVEGTILTVYREAVERLNDTLTDSMSAEAGSMEQGFRRLFEEAARSLERTPQLLKVLQEAGVVDSGGAGLVCIIEGMLNVLAGNPMGAPSGEPAEPDNEEPDYSLFTEDSVLKYGYCTEFLLRLQRGKTDLDGFDIEEFIRTLNTLGDSVVAFRDGTAVKAHVHTMRPSEILAFAQRYGEFLKVKIENMSLQHSGSRFAEAPETPKQPHKAYGVVTVAAGAGIRETFISMGADAVVAGGQSMNPSASDFLEAFRSVNADTILVFPGNSNIILTAEQAAGLYPDADVRVIPCKTVGEIYAALSMLDTTSGDTDAIVAELNEGLTGVAGGSVAKATRDTEMNGIAVKTGDYIGYGGGAILTAGVLREEAVLQTVSRLNAAKYGILLLICGEEVPAEEAKRVCARLTELYPRTEVISIDGGQPVQDYILLLE